jgi:hypothetical protein
LAALKQEQTRLLAEHRRTLAALRKELAHLSEEVAALREQQRGNSGKEPAAGPCQSISAALVGERAAGLWAGRNLQISSAEGGVYISSRHGPGVYAETTNADALVASSLSGHGVHAVGGGVRGGLGTSPGPCGVFAEGGSGDGLYATSDETAIRGVSQAGYGGRFEGGRGQLLLVPAASAGAPTEGHHQAGTLFVDAAMTLWLCMAGGTPGIWKQVVAR